ncbi:MAG TPA: nodulation protein NfeD [Caldilineae bacterium]|nr:nodulation protein NfeD [Caldilineae bacterium]
MRRLRISSWLALLGWLFWAMSAMAQNGPQVDVLTFKGPVTPVLVSYIERGITQAERDGAVALILQLDTPGGSVELTSKITKRMRNANVPIIVYVTPRGAHAGSAGTFITLAAHIAAMAPGTRIGAASPVGAEGEDLGETIRRKITQDLVADIQNMTKRRGEKATEWAIRAVEEAAVATADEALELGVIDIIATNLDDLLRQLDGRTVEVNGREITLRTAGAQVNHIPLGTLESFLNAITNPTIAAILLTLGLNAILFELSNPGGYVAGIMGAVALLLAFYALGALDANWTGLGFIILAFVLFVLDIKAPTHGILTAAGIASFVLGAAILFNVPDVEVPWATIISLSLATAGFFAFAVAKAVGAQRRRPTTGFESLMGKKALARSELNPTGLVFLQGELWQAIAQEGPIPEGEEVEVIGREGMRLIVRKR